ncbi:hypothetical protein TREAZ_1052 [Leadbettera azotonutricia ZAS-9]|uniref:Uncharacterized protein n=1 Tax=Leadbettera azotonutricia (strain ATCC BAA-888 / DSM 13862 / ZAS-9) TaxID=545695 RepID=F5Y7M5_LEAAZ|nr:hypothetical protein TREAZ_1052 [Leadbettera azotonutricia ZAS-9]
MGIMGIGCFRISGHIIGGIADRGDILALVFFFIFVCVCVYLALVALGVADFFLAI